MSRKTSKVYEEVDEDKVSTEILILHMVLFGLRFYL